MKPCALIAAAAIAGVSSKDVGVLYEVWHTKAAQLQQTVAAKGGVQLNTEMVIRSNGSHTLNDVYVKYGLNGDIWNVQPQLGYYCLYKKRPNDPKPPVPDCTMATDVLTAHAKMLTTAGIDYIAVDVTNWPNNDTDGSTDIAVLRPTEVLFETWAALRQQGVLTPAISVWPCSPAGSTTWRYLLDILYNNPAYDDLIYKQDGKKVMFIPYNPTCYDIPTLAMIESNGGRDDVKTIPMWALYGSPFYKQGVWGFFSPCVDEAGGYTTSMVGVSPCNQYPTLTNDTNDLIEVSASGGYMVSQCALPFASPGHFRGLTMARLFEKVLALSPPHIFLSSFNEHIGGRQAPASGAKVRVNILTS